VISLRRTVLAGLFDAGLASLATFAIGLYAARLLPPAALGVYAVFFAAFVMAALVPTHLWFVPVEIQSLRSSGPARLRLLGQTLPLGSVPALLAGILASGAAMAGTAGAATTLTVPLALTSAVCAFVSPVQDHARRMLHFAGRSWRAAAVSVVQLSSCVLALLLSLRLPIPRAWVPFGALSLANIVSLSAAVLLAMEGRRTTPAPGRLPITNMLRSGRWFMVLGLIPALANFVSGILVSRLAGAVALGYVEVARVAGQPLLVLAMGLSAVLRPQLMESGARRRRDVARRLSRIFQFLMLACGLLYLAWISVPWLLNPIPRLLPNAYAVSGLLPLVLVAHLLDGLLPPHRAQLVGADQGPVLIRLEGPACALQVLVSATAAVTGPFAKPLGMLAQGVVGLGLLRRGSDRLYADAEAVETSMLAGPRLLR
jgi:O-antigen/teichoic acid export membrane protein